MQNYTIITGITELRLQKIGYETSQKAFALIIRKYFSTN